MKNFKSTITAYYFNLADVKQAAEYRLLCDRLTASGLEKWETLSFQYTQLETGAVIISSKHLFSNQWNTADDSPTSKNTRVFNWKESMLSNKLIKKGYYLDVTPEMKQALDDNKKCGYCGHMVLKPTATFCTKCIDSSYLDENQLHLLRFHKISDNSNRAPLSENEKARIMPAFIKAQTIGEQSKFVKLLASELKLRDKDIKTANIRYDGMKWLIDNMIQIDNCIYYSHTNTFCFGWRNLLSTAVKKELEIKLADFPFTYEFKAA